MSQPTIRLLHASDFHLEQPLGGVSEVPDHLRASFLDAPYRAVEQVVALAIAENVDALLLSGDVVLPEFAGPRAAVFLIQQFERLADHSIAVYWAGGDVDPPESWPPSAPLPDNVHVFRWGGSKRSSTVATASQLCGFRASAAVRARCSTTAGFIAMPTGCLPSALPMARLRRRARKATAFTTWRSAGNTVGKPLTSLLESHTTRELPRADAPPKSARMVARWLPSTPPAT